MMTGLSDLHSNTVRLMERTSFSGVSKNHRFREYILSTLFMRAKAKQAKIAKNRIKSERCRYIFKEIMAMGLEWE